MNRERGAALILVLMVTGVLGLLILQLGLTARDQVERSQRLLDRARAELRWHTHEAELKFALLTQPWVTGSSVATAGGISTRWRFDNQIFEVGGDVIRLQDVSGLMALPQGGGSMDEFEALLVAVGVTPDRARNAAVALQTRLSAPGSLPIQSVLEFRYLGLTDMEIEKVRAASTSYPSQSFNPSTAPKEVMIARYRSSSEQSALIALREQGKLDASGFAAALNTPVDDITSFFVGPVFRWQIFVTEGVGGVSRERTWVVRPYDSQPLQLWESRDLAIMDPT